MVSPTSTLEPPLAPRLASKYLDDAENVLPLEIDLQHADSASQQALTVALTVCPGLETPATIRPLTGGLSNELFVVNNQVLVRIHPQQPAHSTEQQGIVDRDLENRLVAWLSQQGEGPLFYGRFRNGRVEEFYDGFVPLSHTDMPHFAPDMARLMASLHSRDEWPAFLDVSSSSSHGQIWDRMRTWLDMAASSSSSPSNNNNLLQWCREQLAWLEHNLFRTNSDDHNSQAYDFCRQIVLCHMDCQSLNLLRRGNTLRWIDFEYAALNPRGVDIANTWCEFCDMNNLRADYAQEYPSEEVQNRFLQAYCDRLVQSPLEGLTTKTQQDEFLADLRHEIGRMTLVSHLSWTIWSLVQDRLSTIDFDYLAYAQHRQDGYRYFQQRFF